MKIETERLELIALNADQLRKLIYDMPSLESELKCIYMAEPIEGVFADIVKHQYEITLNNCENYIWHSFILIIRSQDRTVVGMADFKDVPDKSGEVEIGYGLGNEFIHNGYMTESVEAMCAWATNQDGIKSIIAETDIDGYASQRILIRCGFKKISQGETLWWRLSLPK